MKRDIYSELQTWRASNRRKPLLLQGARQTGKTYILKRFGREAYRSVVYCNFEEHSELDAFFQRDLDPNRILTELGIYYDHKIRPTEDLIIFDEIQVSNRALNSLKYFAEERNDIHIVAAGSLLGLKLSTPGSFPVGKVNFRYLYPMTFLEFLQAVGDDRYRGLIEGITGIEPLSDAFHTHLIDRLRQYYFTGGMPEAVRHFAETNDAPGTREIQNEIIRSYQLDFAKHASSTDIPKLTAIWESIPRHLARENKKFIFSAVKKGARAREYDSALAWLRDAGLILWVDAAENDRLPLKHYADAVGFKVYVRNAKT
ncbi:MAG: ATP-binding protein [Desulfobacterales bacterium]|nr:ATP-binding protein [Desulfobacterales bacterium]